MPSPDNLYEFFTDAELATELALLKSEITGGTFENLGGAAKSSSIRMVPIEQRMAAMSLEYRKRKLDGYSVRQSTTYVDMSGYK